MLKICASHSDQLVIADITKPIQTKNVMPARTPPKMTNNIVPFVPGTKMASSGLDGL